MRKKKRKSDGCAQQRHSNIQYICSASAQCSASASYSTMHFSDNLRVFFFFFFDANNGTLLASTSPCIFLLGRSHIKCPDSRSNPGNVRSAPP